MSFHRLSQTKQLETNLVIAEIPGWDKLQSTKNIVSLYPSEAEMLHQIEESEGDGNEAVQTWEEFKK